MKDRREFQDHTQFMPKVREIEERGTVSSEVAISLISVGCALIVCGIMAYDFFFG